MIETIQKCDVSDREHIEPVISRNLPVMFEYDQEDGKSKTKPYFQMLKVDICESCFEFMTKHRSVLYGFGAMGYYKYYLPTR